MVYWVVYVAVISSWNDFSLVFTAGVLAVRTVRAFVEAETECLWTFCAQETKRSFFHFTRLAVLMANRMRSCHWLTILYFWVVLCMPWYFAEQTFTFYNVGVFLWCQLCYTFNKKLCQFSDVFYHKAASVKDLNGFCLAEIIPKGR